MEETLVWYHMEINNTFIRRAENLLSKILWPSKTETLQTSSNKKIVKHRSDKWGVLAALVIEMLTDADLFSWPLLSIYMQLGKQINNNM